MKNRKQKNILWYNEVTNKDVDLVGGKNASLGEMYQKLTKKKVNIPNGFALSAYAYRHFMKDSGLMIQIKEILSDLDTSNMRNLSDRGEKVRHAIMSAELPEDLNQEIATAYLEMEKQYGKNVDTAVRSSATAEDLPDASFAGQQDTYLNIKGIHNVLYATRQCIASLFTNRAISYREDKGFDHFTIALSVGIQKMVRSDRAISGVMFSIDTESGFRDAVLINAAYGLGENIVQGKITPDEFYVFQPTLKKGFKPIVEKTLGSKALRLIYSTEGKSPIKNVSVSIEDRKKFCITDAEIIKLAEWATIIEEHYKRPMDMEWAKDGVTGKLFIVQARPETAQSMRDVNVLEEYIIGKKSRILCSGASVGYKIGKGKVHAIKDVSGIESFKKGEVLVTEMTDPDWEPIMKIASAIVTNSGGRTCHAAIVSRELGIPCVVGTRIATQVIKNGKDVTVSCAEGEEGYIYEGLLDFEVKKTNIGKLKKPKVKIMMNLAEPEQAFTQSFIPNDGVGLAREEFIINNSIKVHPLALMAMDKKTREVKIDRQTINKINKITAGYKTKTEFFVDKLAQGIGKLGAAFYPNDVIVRFSDFKTNEYANLIGGTYFEPKEENPMIGWRGASRYYDDKYRDAFKLECQAIKKVREEFGLTNVIVMVPFCRTVEEGKKVLQVMKEAGLERGKNKLRVYVMAEIPSNIILVDEFAKIFDGFSIGSNDLTQLTMGIDRDNGNLSHIANEKNEAVKILIRQLIKGAHKRKRKVGICGQAPSDFPEFAEFVVKEGIDSISLTPDTVLKTMIYLGKKGKK
ncbi:MAG: phosphoenolpyruvate synthase [Candidatus Pacebacteria bacterium]|nr:phosphoenolpyruvate synthase [Candidatus Paceibacterota bacterium]